MDAYFPIILSPIIMAGLLTAFGSRSTDNVKFRRRFVILCGSILFLTLALRHYSVGSGDGQWYYNNWVLLSEYSFSDLPIAFATIDVEKGYLLFTWVLSHVFPDGQFLFVFYAILAAASVSLFIYRNCKDTVVAFEMLYCLGLWGFMVQGIRQGIAMSICLFALESCKKRKLIPFLLLVALATQFHASAILFFAVYFFPLLKLNAKSYLLSFIGGIVVLFVAPYLISLAFRVMNTAISDSYAVNDIDATQGGIVSVLIYVIILVMCVLFLHKKRENQQVNLMFYMTLFGFVCFMMRYTTNTIAQRASYYFMFGQMALLPMIMHEFKSRGRLLIQIVVLFLCVGIGIYKATYSELIPYIFFWQ